MGGVRQTGMVAIRVTALAAAIAFASACGGEGTGAVTGTLREYGGPATPGGGQALNGEPMPNTVVIATSRTGARTRATTNSQGVFVFKLHPGTYSLSSRCAVVTTVQVRSGAKLDRDLVCSVP
jgi:hypothetical protein